jgi:hypothetical protein
LDAEPVGDAIDVVVVGDDLVGVDDGTVVEAVCAQPVEVVFGDVCRGERQLARVCEQRRQPSADIAEVAGDDRLRQRSVT